MKAKTQKDLAEMLGISQPTVSMVLSDPNTPHVSEETRERVVSAVARLPRNHRLRKPTGNIGYAIAVHTSRDEAFYHGFFLGVEGAALAAGKKVMVQTVRPGEASDVWKPGAIDGLIVMGPLPDSDVEALAKQFPTVLLNYATPRPLCDVVMPDEIGGVANAVSYLHTMGHTDIAFFQVIFGARQGLSIHFTQRLEGYQVGRIRNGLLPVPEYVQSPRVADLDFEKVQGFAQQALEAWQALDAPPTAVIAGNDFLAIALMKAAGKLGIRIPDDLSVVGFDNTAGCEFVTPTLTSIEQDMASMGAAGVELLLSAIGRSRARKPVRALCATRIVERESVRDMA